MKVLLWIVGGIGALGALAVAGIVVLAVVTTSADKNDRATSPGLPPNVVIEQPRTDKERELLAFWSPALVLSGQENPKNKYRVNFFRADAIGVDDALVLSILYEDAAGSRRRQCSAPYYVGRGAVAAGRKTKLELLATEDECSHPPAREELLAALQKAKEAEASFDAQDPWLADLKSKAVKPLETNGGDLLASFAAIQSRAVGDVLKLRVAPSGVVTDPGTIYAEPCDARDPAIGPYGVGPSTNIEEVPKDVAEPMNAANVASFSNKAPIPCYVVTAKLKTKGPVTTLSFVSAVQDGQRAFDQRLDPSGGEGE